jgi:aspartyl aminopeptidase
MLATRSAAAAALPRLFSSAAASVAVMASPAADLVSFINASPSPFHAVAEAERRLTSAGFTRLSERDAKWAVAPGGKYFVTRNQSAVVAFAVGGKYAPGAGGFTIAASHTDSPCLRVKPISTLTKAGYLSLGVETYGGGIWATWFDRDLSIAGRVIVDKGDGSGAGPFESRLVRIGRPICRVPTLAIHLDRTVNDAFKVNAESHLPPVLATAVKAKLEESGPAGAAGSSSSTPTTTPSGTGGAETRHHTGLVKAIAAELGVAPEAVKDFELSLYDTQGAAIGGLYNEFVFSPRLDNLCMMHSVVTGLIASVQGGAAASSPSAAAAAGVLPLSEDPNVRVIAAFDHEEVGSNSVPGAGSTMLEDTIARLCPDASLLPATIRRSILVSADMAHAVHPNYSGVHEENHRPAMHGGVVIKNNTNQRYATTAVTAFLFRRVAAIAGVPVQNFCVRQDMGCGSTIGPIVATRLGLRTVDIGVPQLSMHSCREMCGTDDVAHAATFFGSFFGAFSGVDETVVGTE